MGKNLRPDHQGIHRSVFNKNKKVILHTQEICALCGRPVDKTLKAPHPLSPTVDHIIPINKGGHPSDIDNLQLAHWICNRMKSDKLIGETQPQSKPNKIYQTMDWKNL